MIDALVSDFLSTANIPVAGTTGSAIGKAVNAVIAKRVEQKRTILLEEIKSGNLPLEKLANDEFVSSVWRIHMAIINGAANANLKLLAKVLVGLVRNGQALYADEFLHHATILEGLSYNEILLLGAFCIHQDQYDEEISKRIKEPASPFKRVKDQLVTKDGPFYSEDQFSGCCASASRTGLLIPKSAWGGLIYEASPQMFDLRKLINSRKCLNKFPVIFGLVIAKAAVSLQFGPFRAWQTGKFPVNSLINREFRIPARGKRSRRESRAI